MSERWKSVGDQFTALGEAFKNRYDEPEDDPKSDEVKDALTTVGEGLERLFSSIGDVVRDDDFKMQAKSTMKSLADALADSISEVGVRGGSSTSDSPSEDSDGVAEAEAELEEHSPASDADIDSLRRDVSEDI